MLAHLHPGCEVFPVSVTRKPAPCALDEGERDSYNAVDAEKGPIDERRRLSEARTQGA